VDYNAEAVEAAESYLEFQAFSHAGLVDQLSSEYGDQFTREHEYGASVALGQRPKLELAPGPRGTSPVGPAAGQGRRRRRLVVARAAPGGRSIGLDEALSKSKRGGLRSAPDSAIWRVATTHITTPSKPRRTSTEPAIQSTSSSVAAHIVADTRRVRCLSLMLRGECGNRPNGADRVPRPSGTIRSRRRSLGS